MLATAPSLSPTQGIALQRGLAFLRATRLRFAIELPDQSLLGELPVPQAAMPAKVATVRRHDLEFKYSYHGKVDALEPGQAAGFDCDSEDEASRLVKHIASRGCKKFGNGHCISARRALHVELLRVL